MPISHQLVFQNILGLVAERKASDLHLTAGSPPVMRIDTKLVPVSESPVVTADFIESVAADLLSDEQREGLERDREIVVAHQLNKLSRFRVDFFYQKGTLAATLRYFGGEVKSLRELGFPATVESFAKLSRGLVVVSGPFGSGRTTTLAAFVQMINRTRSEYILTIEQPIEYVFANDKSIVEQREVGRDTPSFGQALASVTDEDVNVVVTSELGGADVIRQALAIAESGRLVFAALDADSAVKVIEKLVVSFPPDEQPQIRLLLAAQLVGVICQRLLPRIGGGQVSAAEILLATPPIRAVIREGAFNQIYNIVQTSREEGMQTLDRSLVELVQGGVVSLPDALQHAFDKNSVRQLVR